MANFCDFHVYMKNVYYAFIEYSSLRMAIRLIIFSITLPTFFIDTEYATFLIVDVSSHSSDKFRSYILNSINLELLNLPSELVLLSTVSLLSLA